MRKAADSRKSRARKPEATLDPKKAAYLTVQLAIAVGRELNLTFEDIWTTLPCLAETVR